MFSFKKAMTPVAMNTSRPNMMIVRRVRPNARMAFSTARLSLYAWSVLSSAASGESARRHVAEQDGAVGDDQLAGLHAVEDLVVALALQPDLDLPLDETTPIGGDPGRHRAVTLADDAVHRHGDGLH